jgi:hypothetical protein
MAQPYRSKYEHQASFQHTSLDLHRKCIRLLEVHPQDRPSDPVQCTIRHATLDEEYACLSYVWGPEQPSHYIHVNDRRFRVRQNLYEFLVIASSKSARRHNLHVSPHQTFGLFDFKKVTQAIWVDALCIDQDNEREKNHQVRLFGDIYSSATVVVAWMGNNPGLKKLFRKWKYLDIMRSIPGYFSPILQGLQPLLEKHLLGSETSIRTQFVGNTYWTRAWTTQESLRAQGLLFLASDRALEVNTLLIAGMCNPQIRSQAYVIWEQLVDSQASICRDVVPGSTQKQQYETLTSSLDRLWACRERRCTEPRDKIFSLLSVSSNGHEMEVNYHVPPEEIALKFLRINLESFCMCHTVMVFDTLERSALHLLRSTELRNRKDFVEAQLHMENGLDDNTPFEHADLRLGLTCHHINKKPYMNLSLLTYHTRSFECGSLRLQKPSAPGPSSVHEPIHPIYWVDSLTQEYYVFTEDEHIYFVGEREDSCTIRFSLPAFTRMVTLLGNDARTGFTLVHGDRLDNPAGDKLSKPVVLAAPPGPEQLGPSEQTFDWPKDGQTHVYDVHGDFIPIKLADPNPKWTLLSPVDRPSPI